MLDEQGLGAMFCPQKGLPGHVPLPHFRLCPSSPAHAWQILSSKETAAPQ